MTDYEFTLIFDLPDSDADPEDYIDALAAAGCNDAVIGIGQRGRVALYFGRTATSAGEAYLTALRDVHNAIPRSVMVAAYLPAHLP